VWANDKKLVERVFNPSWHVENKWGKCLTLHNACKQEEKKQGGCLNKKRGQQGGTGPCHCVGEWKKTMARRTVILPSHF
jgi:hypothetical protein